MAGSQRDNRENSYRHFGLLTFGKLVSFKNSLAAQVQPASGVFCTNRHTLSSLSIWNLISESAAVAKIVRIRLSVRVFISLPEAGEI